MIVNPDVVDVNTGQKTTKTPRKAQKINNLLKMKRLLNIKMSGKGGLDFTLSLPQEAARPSDPRQLRHWLERLFS